MKKHIKEIVLFGVCAVSLFTSFFVYLKLFSVQDEIQNLRTWKEGEAKNIMAYNDRAIAIMATTLRDNAGNPITPEQFKQIVIQSFQK